MNLNLLNEGARLFPHRAFFMVFLFITCLSWQVFGQSRVVSGTITDDSGEPVIGARVVVKGQGTYGVISNLDGTYIFNLPTDADSLQVSSVSYATQSAYIGNRSVIDFVLSDDLKQLSEVVVTALGVRRDKRALGYAIQEVAGEEVSEARETNLVNSLAGKVAGVNITSGNSGIGGSSRITIRGEISLANDNQPLFVVDGIPINNQVFGSSQSGQDIDFGNGAAEINPDDIATISVLKGPSAAALYGSRAANGVILITTKSGKGSEGLGISVNTNYAAESVLKLPDFQNKYGQGRGGVYNIGDGGRSWGPLMDGRLIEIPVNTVFPPTEGGEIVEWVPYPDNVKEFYKTGHAFNNNISLTGGNDQGHFRLSYTNTQQTGIVPNTDIERNNISFKAGYNLSNKLTVNASANYIKTDSDNRPVISYGNESVGYTWLWEGRQVPTSKMEDYWFKGLEGTQPFTYNFRFNDNPYYTVNENLNAQYKDRLIGNINLTYQLTTGLSLMLRSGTDFSSEKRTNWRTPGSRAFPNGMYRQDRMTFREVNSDFLLSYEKSIDEDWQMQLSVGGNRMMQTNESTSAIANELSLPGIYNLGNTRIPLDTDQFDQEKKINSLYGFGQIAYQNMLFLDFTARNDWSSTLPAINSSYFYPSVSLSAVVTDILEIASNSPLSYAKVRLSLAQVGNDTDPYNLRNVYNYGTAWGSTQTVTESSTIANNDLKPETVTSYEVGTDLRFFNGRIGFDLTYYNSISKDQILGIPVDRTSGYSRRFINAGEIQNQGFEVMFSATPIKLQNSFSWNVNLNWSRNRTEVLELAEGLTTYQLPSRYVSVEARVGGRMGDMYGRIFERDPEGNIIHVDGLAQTTNEVHKIGNYNPDWMAGIYNTFNYKNFSLGVLFDWRKGGEIYSRTNVIGNQAGQLVESLPGRENGHIGEGVMIAENGVFVRNDISVSAERYWGGGSYYNRSNVENSTFDATYVKLREATIGYTIKRIGNSFLRDMKISLVGRNLFLWTDVPHIDPETNSLNGGSILPGVEAIQLPSTRSIGFNISFKL